MAVNAKQTDPWMFFYKQAEARQEEQEKHISVADNWERVIREEPQDVLTAPQALARRIEKGVGEAGETEGDRVMRLWDKRGIAAAPGQ